MGKKYMKLRSVFKNACRKYDEKICLYPEPFHFTEAADDRSYHRTLNIEIKCIANFQIEPVSISFFYRYKDIARGIYVASPCAFHYFFIRRDRISESNT